MLFESLDFLYVPATDIQESVRYYTNILDGELLWKIHAYGVWVACIKLSNKEPYILLADHIERKDLILIYRVDHIDKTCSELKSRGWIEEKNWRSQMVLAVHFVIQQAIILQYTKINVQMLWTISKDGLMAIKYDTTSVQSGRQQYLSLKL